MGITSLMYEWNGACIRHMSPTLGKRAKDLNHVLRFSIGLSPLSRSTHSSLRSVSGVGCGVSVAGLIRSSYFRIRWTFSWHFTRQINRLGCVFFSHLPFLLSFSPFPSPKFQSSWSIYVRSPPYCSAPRSLSLFFWIINTCGAISPVKIYIPFLTRNKDRLLSVSPLDLSFEEEKKQNSCNYGTCVTVNPEDVPRWFIKCNFGLLNYQIKGTVG